MLSHEIKHFGKNSNFGFFTNIVAGGIIMCCWNDLEAYIHITLYTMCMIHMCMQRIYIYYLIYMYQIYEIYHTHYL